MSFVSLHTALSGIRAGRAGMDTAAHNVANANTPGYTRQRVNLTTSYPYLSPNGPMGTGVTVEDISRIRDTFLDQRVRSDVAASGALDVRAELMARAEQVLGEPEAGLTRELSELWASFEELALRPDDGATRRQVLSAMQSLAARVNSVDGGLTTLRADTTTSLAQGVAEVNALFDQLADLNASVADASAGVGTPNDLLDERDRVVDQLARRIGATATFEDDGTVRLSVAGLGVVSGRTARHLSVASSDGVPPVVTIVHDTAGVAVRPGGEIGGMQRFLNDDLTTLSGRLDGFVNALADTVNAQHAGTDPDGNVTGSYTLDGTPGGPVFGFGPRDDPAAVVDPSARVASTFKMVIDSPDQLAAAIAPDAPHDGRNATALAELRSRTSLDGDLRALITEQAADVAATRRAAEGQRQLTSASRSTREGMHGVSLDEEMVSMLSYQHALEASSRVMSAVDEALDVIINRTGLVGR